MISCFTEYKNLNLLLIIFSLGCFSSAVLAQGTNCQHYTQNSFVHSFPAPNNLLYPNYIKAKRFTTKPNPSHANFGKNMAADGRTLVVSSNGELPLGRKYSGQVSVYERHGSSICFVGNLTNPKGTRSFGTFIDISKDRIIASAVIDDQNQTPSYYRSVFIFRRINGSWMQEAQLHSPESLTNPFFGWDVAIHGNKAVVGAGGRHWDKNEGAAYIYEFTSNHGWKHTQTLKTKNKTMTRNYGHKVDISPTHIAVAGYTTELNSTKEFDLELDLIGTVHVYSLVQDGKWNLQQEILRDDDYESIRGGLTVRLDGNQLGISQRFYSKLCDRQFYDCNRSVILMHTLNDQNVWVQDHVVSAADIEPNNNFGNSFDLKGNNLIVGARNTVFKQRNSGSAYLFKKINGMWKQVTKLKGYPAQARSDAFGGKVRFMDKGIVISSKWSDFFTQNDRMGSLYYIE